MDTFELILPEIVLIYAPYILEFQVATLVIVHSTAQVCVQRASVDNRVQQM